MGSWKYIVFRMFWAHDNFLDPQKFIRDPGQFTRDTLHAPIRLSQFEAGVFSPFRGGMFFKSLSHGRLSSSAYSWLNSYNTEDRARETVFQTTTPQGKPYSILSKLQYCVSHEVFFFAEVSYMFIPRHLCDS